ncbi:MAG TPA: DUF2935 domain-containing protein [Dehalococcoidia bacterium]|jgi:hypothetical protein
MFTYTRSGDHTLELPYEKPVIVPEAEDSDPARHAWADARFAADIMSEHGLFFALLMPEEVAATERRQALEFSKTFATMFDQIDQSGPPERTDVKSFVGKVTEAIKPFIEYKAGLGEAQRQGKLRSLVWPLFFDHTQHEAERWTRRLESLALGEPDFDRSEVVKFWCNIMDEHARFVAHLLDPDEFKIIEKAMGVSRVFDALGSDSPAGTIAATLREPATVVGSLIQNPETDAVLSAAETILDFKTETARNIEAARIKSIIDPRLADHVRREALKFVDELKRVS